MQLNVRWVEVVEEDGGGFICTWDGGVCVWRDGSGPYWLGLEGGRGEGAERGLPKVYA